MALAQAVLSLWERLDKPGRLAFFNLLQDRFGPDHAFLDKAIEAYRAKHQAAAISVLHHAAEPRPQELLRRLNLASDGAPVLVRMTEHAMRPARVDRRMSASLLGLGPGPKTTQP